MKLSKLALAGAIAGLLSAGTAYAEAETDARPEAQQTTYNYNYYTQEDEQAGAKERGVEGEPDAMDSAQQQPSYSNGNGAEENKPWMLMDELPEDGFLKRNRIVVSGWTEYGYQNHPDGAFTGNGALLTEPQGGSASGEWRHPNLNQQWFFAERLADGKEGRDWGFRIDTIYGVDGFESQSFGNVPGRWDYLNGWDHGIYHWAIPQAYAQVAFNEKLSVKVGHFFTPTGYEVIPPLGNFFFSRQITWYNGEAFTHTGALVNYAVNKKFTLIGGYFLGWDTGFNQLGGGNNGMFGFTWNPTDKTSIAYWSMVGNFGWRGDGFTNGFIVSQKWTDKLMTVHQFDTLSTNNPVDFAVNGVVRNDIALVNYAFYQLTHDLKLGVRSEWFKADGISYNTFTYGVNIRLTNNLIIRPEGRYLWAPGVANPNAPGTTAQNVYDVFGNSTVAGCDAVWTF